MALRLTQKISRSGVILGGAGAMILAAGVGPAWPSTLHYAPNHNFGPSGDYMPGKVGFNIADVSSVKQLDSLTGGVRGLAWIGQCGGVDSAFLKEVRPYVGNAKLFGLNLMDDPDPRPRGTAGRLSAPCTAPTLKAEADWVHLHMPGVKTFITLMNMSNAKTPSYRDSYNPTNSHIDLFGVAAYPCRTEINGCDFDMINRVVTAAEAAGIPSSDIVPVFQAFGGGKWTDDGGGTYTLPTVSQQQQILDRWGSLLPQPELDVAYSWGSQEGDKALENSPDLQTIFSIHNRGTGTASADAEVRR